MQEKNEKVEISMTSLCTNLRSQFFWSRRKCFTSYAIGPFFYRPSNKNFIFPKRHLHFEKVSRSVGAVLEKMKFLLEGL